MVAQRSASRSTIADGGAAPRIGWMSPTIMTLLSLSVAAPFVSAGPTFTGDGNLFRQGSYTAVFVVATFAARAVEYPRRLMVVPFSMLLALCWCGLSVSWAISPDIAVRRLILTSLIIWTIFILIDRAGYELTVEAIRRTFAFVLVANYLAVIVSPSFGIHQVSDLTDPGIVGSWRGVMLQKNYAGSACACTIIMLMFDTRLIRASLRWGLLGLTAVFLVKTNSKTSAGILLVALAAGMAYRLYDPRHRVFVVTSIVAGAVAAIIGVNVFWDALAAPFHTADAFTGRVQIWPVVLAYYHDHVLFGAGYGSFWNVGPYSPIYNYTEGWVAKITSAHNGYIDLLTQIGLPGLLLVILAFIAVPLLKLLWSRSMSKERGALVVALIVFSAGDNLTETSLLDRDSLVHVMLVIAVALGKVAQPQVVRAPVRVPAVRHAW